MLGFCPVQLFIIIQLLELVMRIFIVIGAVALLCGCAIHPLPEDVAGSRSTTINIVQKIRCEARQAIKDHALDSMRIAEFQRAEDRFIELSSAQKDLARSKWRRDASSALPPKLKAAAIGYSFKFSITDNDNSSGGASFLFPFSNGTFSLGVNVGEDKKRKAERNFDLAEDFADLLADVSAICERKDQIWKYPITGDIGLNESIKTFINLAGLSKFPDLPLELVADQVAADRMDQMDANNPVTSMSIRMS